MDGHPEACQPDLFNEEHCTTLTLVLRYVTWNHTLHPQVVWVQLPHDNGDVFPLTADYDIMEALQLSGGMVIYQTGKRNNLLYPFRKNDRILFGMKIRESGVKKHLIPGLTKHPGGYGRYFGCRIILVPDRVRDDPGPA